MNDKVNENSELPVIPDGVVKAVVKTIGRPTIYPQDETDELEKIRLSLEMFGRGHSPLVVMIEVWHTTRETMYRWAEDDDKPLFNLMLKNGKALYQAYWERLAIRASQDKSIQAIPLIFNLKSRFRDDWQERSAIQVTAQQLNSTEHTDAMLTKYLPAQGVEG